jgi:hypothetical protein
MQVSVVAAKLVVKASWIVQSRQKAADPISVDSYVIECGTTEI